MATHASRDTTTGLEFEKQVSCEKDGIDLTKYKLYKYLDSQGINWNELISRKLLPDEAYWNPVTKELNIFEKKFQQTEGSADEKPQTCGFKIWEFSKIGKALGATKVTYTYILSDWFNQPKYADMLEYIASIPGCSYMFVEE